MTGMKAPSLAIGLVALAVMSEGVAAAQPVTVAWTVEPARSHGKSQKVQLSLSHRVPGSHTQISRTVSLADLPGLSAAQFASATGAQTRFRIARAAGDLDCRGAVRQRRGSGDCAFVPNAGFARELSRHGIATPTAAQQFRLAMHDVDLGMVTELRRQGYAPLDLERISSAAVHGVTSDYLRAMDAAGVRAGTVDRLVQMRVHRVTPAFVRDMAAAGYTRLTPEQLVSLRIHGVDPKDARRANAALRRGQ